MPGEHSPAQASSVRVLKRGSGMPMSRGWVPCGKHATLVCWDLVARKGRGQGPVTLRRGWTPLPVCARL